MVECEPIELLHGVPLFSELGPEALAELACQVRRQQFASGQTIFHRGDQGDGLHIIHRGRVRIEVPSADGPPVILRVLEPGEFFGELALCDGHPRSASAVAMAPTETLALCREDFQEFLRHSPEAAIHILGIVSLRLRDTSERLTESIFYDTTSRLARRLLQLAESGGVAMDGQGVTIQDPITPEELAELVGSTVDRMRQELDSLEQDQILTVRDDRITIRRPALLRERIQRKATVGPGSVTIPTWLLE
jgi:CRP/FNR family transcriptional regulator/CRP/FNR family cyclic AMP-dependent transcriptional regulator